MHKMSPSKVIIDLNLFTKCQKTFLESFRVVSMPDMRLSLSSTTENFKDVFLPSNGPHSTKSALKNTVFSNLIVSEDLRTWRNAFECIFSESLGENLPDLQQNIYPIIAGKDSCWLCIRLR